MQCLKCTYDLLVNKWDELFERRGEGSGSKKKFGVAVIDMTIRIFITYLPISSLDPFWSAVP